jgi:hypothetical protein
LRGHGWQAQRNDCVSERRESDEEMNDVRRAR